MATKVRLTPDEAYDKLSRNLKNASADIQAGIDRVTENPCAKAAAKKEKMLRKLTESVQNGKWEAGLNRVTLEDWKAKARDKGVARIGPGIDGARSKSVDFFTKFFPHLERGMAEVDKMADMTIEDSVQRAAHMIRHNAAFKR